MKKTVFFAVTLLLALVFSGGAFARHLGLEDASNVLKEKQFEIGIDGSYGYDKWTVVGMPGTEYEVKDITSMLKGRFSLSEKSELVFTLPYKIMTGTTTGVGSNELRGRGTSSLLFKALIKEGFPNVAIGGILDLPGNPQYTLSEGPSLGEGYNLGFFFASTKEVTEKYTATFNGTTKICGKYTNISEVEVSPALFTKLALGLAWKNNNFTLNAETYFCFFNNYKINDVEQPGTGGNIWFVTLGGRLDLEKINFNAGIDFSVGAPTFRPYNYKVFGGVSVIFG
jgi:hypothetical protein